jgi:hypothetical protein
VTLLLLPLTLPVAAKLLQLPLPPYPTHCSFQQSGGTVSLEFERPIAASGDAANDGTLAIPMDGPVTLIMARGPGNGFSDLNTDYHG